MKKIALVNGPGAGKTTLMHALLARLKSMGGKWYSTPEYAREHIDRWGKESITRASDVLLIAYQQLEREKKVNAKADGFVTDSPLILPWFYGRNLKVDSHGERYIVLTRLYKMFIRGFMDYDLIVYVNREKEYVDDGCRYQTEDEARKIDIDIKAEILAHGFPLFEVSGTTEERVDQIVEKLYGNVQSPRPKQSPR